MSTAARALARRRWAKRDIEKVCPHCGQPFKGDAAQVYCTPAHQNAAGAKRWRAKKRPPAASSSAGQGEER